MADNLKWKSGAIHCSSRFWKMFSLRSKFFDISTFASCGIAHGKVSLFARNTSIHFSNTEAKHERQRYCLMRKRPVRSVACFVTTFVVHILQRRFLRCFRDTIWVSKIENRVSRIRRKSSEKIRGIPEISSQIFRVTTGPYRVPTIFLKKNAVGA